MLSHFKTSSPYTLNSVSKRTRKKKKGISALYLLKLKCKKVEVVNKRKKTCDEKCDETVSVIYIHVHVSPQITNITPLQRPRK